MSSLATALSFQRVSTLLRHRRLPAWAREPLVHFIFLGAAIFLVDYIVVGMADDPHTIVIGADIVKNERDTFRAARGREPDAAELAAVQRVWLDNEILYREGLAQQLDKGDTAIRERVIFKALSMIDASVKLPPIDDKGLRAWFEAHHDKYDVPARYDFEEALLGGDTSEESLRRFVASLNAGNPGDARASLRVFKGRPRSNLVESYGADFAKSLEDAHDWRVIKARDGWHAMHLVAITPAQPANYEALRSTILQDWKDITAAEQRTAAVRALGKKYKVREEQAGQ